MNRRQKKKYQNRGYHFHCKKFKEEFCYVCKTNGWDKKSKTCLETYIIMRDTLKIVKSYSHYKFKPHFNFDDFTSCFKTYINKYHNYLVQSDKTNKGGSIIIECETKEEKM